MILNRIYIDNCVLNRPFDDPGQDRIRAEVKALSVVLEAIRRGRIKLVPSEWIRFENDRCSELERRQWVRRILSMTVDERRSDASIEDRARAMATLGVKGIDALHLASAESLGVAVFLTCDDRLSRAIAGHCAF